jgi:solute carrier family 35
MTTAIVLADSAAASTTSTTIAAGTARADAYTVAPTDASSSTAAGASAVASKSSSPHWVSAATAGFYATTSLVIIVINKIVLTSWGFPSYTALAIAQFAATCLLLLGARALGYTSFPLFPRNVFRHVMPLPLVFALNTVTGLGGTQRISLPMFTVLRRFTIVLTMILEFWLLGKTSSHGVKFSVMLLVAGAFVAALNDLSFDATGYFLIMTNNLCSALNCVVLKKKLDENKPLGTNGLLFYNSFFSLPVVAAVWWLRADQEIDAVMQFAHWSNPVFLSLFFCAAIMGCLLNLSIFLCTHHNSALTTMIVGSLKNVVSTYIGMFLGNDYIFTTINFMGLNLSVLGTVVYSYVTSSSSKPRVVHAKVGDSSKIDASVRSA